MANGEKEPQKVKDRIVELLDKGYKRSQLINDFEFAPSTVDTVIREYKENHGGELPAQRSLSANEGKFEVVKMDTKQIVPPEQALRGIRLQDGEYREGFIDGMGTLIMAARYNQILAASQSEILTNQIKIMEESRKGSIEMAQEAAAQAAAEVGARIAPRIDQLASQIAAGSSNPMMSMLAPVMQPVLQQVMGNLMAAFQPKSGQSQQPGESQVTQPGAQPAAQPAGQQPSAPPVDAPPIEKHSLNEWEE